MDKKKGKGPQSAQQQAINTAFLKKLEQKNSHSEGLFPMVFAMSPTMMAVTHPDGRYLEVNNAFCQATGYLRDELLDKNSMELGSWSPEQRREILDLLARDGKIRDREIYWQNKSGSTHCCIMSADTLEVDGEKLILSTLLDITDRKKMEEELREREAALALHADKLDHLNEALQVLLDESNRNQQLIAARLQSNVNELITPYLEKMKDGQTEQMDRVCLSVLESNIQAIASPFAYNLASRYPNLSPKEIGIANLVADGKNSDEIAQLLGISPGTVNAHRNNLRKKLGLSKGKANLRSHLLAQK